MAEAEFKKGAPSIQPGEQQLPLGQAGALNEGLAAAQPPPGVQFRKPPATPQGSIGDQDMLLAGPSDRPTEPVSTRSGVGTEVPEEVILNGKEIVEAARDPFASPAVRSLARLLDLHING